MSHSRKFDITDDLEHLNVHEQKYSYHFVESWKSEDDSFLLNFAAEDVPLVVTLQAMKNCTDNLLVWIMLSEYFNVHFQIHCEDNRMFPDLFLNPWSVGNISKVVRSGI